MSSPFIDPSILKNLSPDDWAQLLQALQRLLTHTDLQKIAQTMVETLSKAFEIDVAQVWLRVGELDPNNPTGGRLTEELELVAQRQNLPSNAPPQRISLHDSLSGFVATEGVPYEWHSKHPASDEWEDCQWAEQVSWTKGQAVPLFAQGRPIGSLTIWEKNPHPNALVLIKLVAEHGSLAFSQIRRLQITRRQVQWFAGLQHVTGALASQLSLNDLYQLIFDQVAQIFPMDGFSIHLYNEKHETLENVFRVETAGNRHKRYPPEPPRPVHGLSWERVIKAQESILLNRAPRPKTPFTSKTSHQPSSDPQRAASIMYAPMTLRDHVIGVMCAKRYTSSAYDQEMLDLLSVVANQAALAIENVRLLDRLNQQITKTQNANRLTTQFVANISHEVRTPLNAIIGFTRIVRRKSTSTLSEQQIRNLDHVLHSADHLLQLINELLDLSRLEAGRVMLQPEKVDLPQIIHEATAEFEPIAKETGNSLQVEIAETIHYVYTDPTRIRQILLNLLSNALKFTRAGQIVVTANRPRSLRPEEEGWETSNQISFSGQNAYDFRFSSGSLPDPSDYFYIEISDTGEGIQSSSALSLFKEFHQESTGDSRLYNGMGLGLSIVQKLSELMAGAVWVKSEPGEGSVFRVLMAELDGADTSASESHRVPHPDQPSSRQENQPSEIQLSPPLEEQPTPRPSKPQTTQFQNLSLEEQPTPFPSKPQAARLQPHDPSSAA